ncbi:hypothetical protein FKM82_003973 [Ascaphus truei]
MAAAYKLIVSKVTCYNSVVLDSRIQNVVHYCPGNCQVHRLGVHCIVAHHSVCSELLRAPEGSSVHSRDVGYKMPGAESVAGSEDYSHLNPRIKKASAIQGTGSLKDITGEAINLASGKTKEFSFEKLRNSSNQHINFRKGRKVRPESFSRKSADYDFIYGHIGNNENCPPFGFSPAPGSEEKAILSHNGSLEQSISSMASLYLQGLSEENLISQILKKHKLDSSGSGEDIKMCLDILLKCSDDLKKCTNIIKQCIKNRSVGGSSSVGEGKGDDSYPNPEIIYMEVMARLSSYLKKLPFEMEHGPHGRAEPSDLAELVSSLHSLQQQHPFSPIYGHEQPPKYEDVVQLPPSVKVISSSATTEITPQSGNDDEATSLKSLSPVAPPLPAKSWQRGIQQNQTGAVKNCPAPSHKVSTSKTCERLSRDSMEKLFIEEDTDLEKALDYQKSSAGSHRSGPYVSGQWMAERQSQQKSFDTNVPIVASVKSNNNPYPSCSSNGNTRAATPAHNTPATVPSKVAKSNDQEEIDKLLLDLERFSQKIESTLNTPPLHSPVPSKALTGLPDFKEQSSPPSSSAVRAKEANKHKLEDDDRNLLLRILGSIEDFAQELVESRSGKGTLSKQKEVMQILQETLVPPPSIHSPSFHNKTEGKDSGPTLSIQQTPEVIKRPSSELVLQDDDKGHIATEGP